jgi:acyl dehydratase
MPMDWNDLALGTEAGRFEITITDAVIDNYLAIMDLDVACYRRATPPFDTRIAPSAMVPKLAMTDLSENFCNRVVGPNIRAKQAFQFFAPVRVGTTVSAVCTLVDKYEKRERRFVTLEALFIDADGTKLVLDRRTQLVLPPDFAMKS